MGLTVLVNSSVRRDNTSIREDVVEADEDGDICVVAERWKLRGEVNIDLKGTCTGIDKAYAIYSPRRQGPWVALSLY